MKSPVTCNEKCTIVDSLDVNSILKSYKENYDIDVSQYFNGVNQVDIYQCLETGYRFYYPFTLAGDSMLYEMLQNSLGRYYYPGWKYENDVALKYIQKNNIILDIGCGDGVFLEEVKKRKPTTITRGLEFNEKAIDKCATKGLVVFNEFVDSHAKSGNKYDVVTAFQVLEHIADVKSFIEGAVSLLKKGGFFIIGVPHCNPFIFRDFKYDPLNCPPHHMGLWNAEAFSNLSKFFSIELVSIDYDPNMKMRRHEMKTNSEIKKIVIKNRYLNSLIYRLLLFKNLLYLGSEKVTIQGHSIIAVFKKV